MELFPQSTAGPGPGEQTFRAPRSLIVGSIIFFSAVFAVFMWVWGSFLEGGVGFFDGLIIGVPLSLVTLAVGLHLLSGVLALIASFLPTEWVLKVQEERVLVTVRSIESRTPEAGPLEAPQLGDGSQGSVSPSTADAGPVAANASAEDAPVPRDLLVLALDYAELKAARRASITTVTRSEDFKTLIPRVEDFVDLHVSGAVAAELEGFLTPEGAIRLPWISSAVLEALEAAGVEIADDLKVTHEPPPIDLNPIRQEVQQLIHDGKPKEAHALMTSSALLKSLPIDEMKEFLSTIEFETQTA